MWDVARPVVERYVKENIGPRALLRDLSKSAAAIARFGPRLPGLIENALAEQAKPKPPTPKADPALPAPIWFIAGVGATVLAIWIAGTF